MLQLCEFAHRGRLPVAGGVLDQTQSFLDALSFYESERARCRAQRRQFQGEDD